MDSPELAPLRPFTPSKVTSPIHQRPGSSSSFSSIRSGGRRQSTYSNRRLSNASRFSNGFDEALSPLEQRNGNGNGMGTLADELDFADDDDDWEQAETTMIEEDGEETSEDRPDSTVPDAVSPTKPATTEGSRDSGIDVSGYHKGPRRRTAGEAGDQQDSYSKELELAMQDVADLAQASMPPKVDTTARTLSALRDLPNQASLETLSHRLTTSTNSITSAMLAQTKALQSLVSSVFSPLLSFIPFSADAIDELLSHHASLLRSLPLLPDPAVANQFSKLNRDTSELQSALSSLLDSLQMGKQLSTGAARHLQVTNHMVTELRREHERAEEARFYLEREGWDAKLGSRWCAEQCKDVVGGFEHFADGLRASIEGGPA